MEKRETVNLLLGVRSAPSQLMFDVGKNFRWSWINQQRYYLSICYDGSYNDGVHICHDVPNDKYIFANWDIAFRVAVPESG